MTIMKIINTRIIVLLLFILVLPGCYTIVWEPDMEFPNENNSEYSGSSYYENNYYGDYNYFYNYPWWLSINPPTKDIIRPSDRNSSINTLRNSGDGRNPNPPDGRNPGGIVNTPPPSRDGSNDNGGSNSGNSGSTNDGKTRDVTDKGTTTNNNIAPSRPGNTGNSTNTIRNTDGNRNSDGKKR